MHRILVVSMVTVYPAIGATAACVIATTRETTVKLVSMGGNYEICMKDSCEISKYGRPL